MSNSVKNEIIQAIDKIFVPGNYFCTEYLALNLKKQPTINFINEIIVKSGKTPIEAIIILLVAIRYINKDIYALNKLEETNTFEQFLSDNYTTLLETSIRGKVQGNAPERGLPVLEILTKLMPNKPVGIIELGASFGLIGNFLLNPEIILENKKEYFPNYQKIPESSKKINAYLGIDINPPDKDWLISCILNTDDAKRIFDYINKLTPDNNFQLIKASALGFSQFKETADFISKDLQIVILTSFMLYQLNLELQKHLTDEILLFCKKYNAHWISQEVKIIENSINPEYYIELDGTKIINLKDDKCSNWNWLN